METESGDGRFHFGQAETEIYCHTVRGLVKLPSGNWREKRSPCKSPPGVPDGRIQTALIRRESD